MAGWRERLAVIIAAKYALLGPGIVRQDVRVEVDGPRILSIAAGNMPGALRADRDFGLAVIAPGLVNPHTHLELEFCAGQVPFSGSFTDWLQRIRDIKQQRGNRLSELPRASLKQLAACGCATVADHHASNLDWDGIASSGLNYFPLREVFGFNNHAPDRARLLEMSRYSWAPHAPYTASLEVIHTCRALADELGRPLSIHLGEYRRETEFIMNGHDAEIDELHARAGTVDPAWHGAGQSPVRYLGDAGILTPQTLAVHVNYLEPGDLEVLAGLKPTVVYCPRSHRFFKHDRHPLEQYLAAGVPVALGTDSLASNTQLSPLHEAALVREVFPAVAAAEVFKMVTVNALAPFGLAGQRGRLEPGCFADLAVFPLPTDPGADFTALFDALCATRSSALTLANGEVVHSTAAVQAAV
jgi:aminodeoxyfutalosine deaminase